MNVVSDGSLCPRVRLDCASQMALQMHSSLVGRGLAASSSSGRSTKPWSGLSSQKLRGSKDLRKCEGARKRDLQLAGALERFACCARADGEAGNGGSESKLESCAQEASYGSRMAELLGALRPSSVGGDCDGSLPVVRGLWREVSAGLLCSCAVATPGMASLESVAASDFLTALVTLGGALGILQFFDELAKRDFLEKTLSRKLCHILSGLVFMLFWPFFSSSPLAKYMAAFAPFANGVRMIGLGLGLWRNEALVKAISREGGQRELLRGPLYYAITITIATLCFWRNSPVGACAVATLCAGDGFADIMGRKYGTSKLPYNSSKSYVGSVAFFVFASLASMGYVAYFSAFGFFTATAKMYLATLGVALASAVAESLPLPLDDNFTVPFTAIGVGMLLLPY